MKIIIAADIYPPDIGGPATYSTKLKNELEQRSHTVDLICYSDKPGNDVVRISKKGFTPLRYLRYLRQLKKIAKDADVIYAMGPVSAGWPAMKAAQKLGKPLVVKVVGDYAWEQARNSGVTELGIDEFQKQPFGGKIGKLQKIERDVCNVATKVITPSNYLKSIVEGWGVEHSKVKTIYNSIEWPAEELRNKPKDKNILVSVGRLVPWKGFEVLIRLMPKLRKEINPELTLKIFGSGPLQQKLETLIAELQLESVVTIEHVSHEQLLEKMSDAGGFILNTGYEGLSHTLLEAMSLGLPVAASKIKGNEELVTDGVNGHLFEYDNEEQIVAAIQKLQKDCEDKDFTLDSSSFEGKFDYDTMISQTEKVLKDIA